MAETALSRPANHLAQRIRLQRYALLWERVWEALHWPLLIVGVWVIAIASGVVQNLSPQSRLSAWVAFAFLFVASLKPLLNVLRHQAPKDHEAMRRMEIEAGLSHRRVSSSGETLVRELDQQASNELWLPLMPSLWHHPNPTGANLIQRLFACRWHSLPLQASFSDLAVCAPAWKRHPLLWMCRKHRL
jgi:hypothetical protein